MSAVEVDFRFAAGSAAAIARSTDETQPLQAKPSIRSSIMMPSSFVMMQCG
ncbi:MAG: hypothetical protein HPM95_17940 [Alphaproteobacteria bacterium]|nr:hypothetical protein [Alphaproteobacteria bacterium]